MVEKLEESNIKRRGLLVIVPLNIPTRRMTQSSTAPPNSRQETCVASFLQVAGG